MKIDTIPAILNLSQQSAICADVAGMPSLFAGLLAGDSVQGEGSFEQLMRSFAIGDLPASATLPIDVPEDTQELGESDPVEEWDSTEAQINAILGGLLGQVQRAPIPQPQPELGVGTAELPSPATNSPLEPKDFLKQEPLSRNPVKLRISAQPLAEADCHLPCPTGGQEFPLISGEGLGPSDEGLTSTVLESNGSAFEGNSGDLVKNEVTRPTLERQHTLTGEVPGPKSKSGVVESTSNEEPKLQGGQSKASTREHGPQEDLVSSIPKAHPELNWTLQQFGSDSESDEVSGALTPSIKVIRAKSEPGLQKPVFDFRPGRLEPRTEEMIARPPADFRDIAPVPARDFVQHIEQIVVDYAERNDSSEPASVILRLDPPELGRVNVHLSMTADEIVSIRMVASDDVARQIIERQMNELQQSLADQGVALDSCQVESSSFGARSDERRMPFPNPGSWESIPYAATRKQTNGSSLVERKTAGRVDYVA